MIELGALFMVFIGLIPDEVLLINYSITYGLGHGLTLPIFIILFIATDLIAIPTVYFLYDVLHRKFLKRIFAMKKIKNSVKKLRVYSKEYGNTFGLVFLGFIGNIWFASLLAAFLKFKMKDALIGLTIGSTLFFLFLYFNIKGMVTFIPKFPGSIFLIAIFVFLISILVRFIVKKLIEKRKG
ncbi:MAG: small multi-drug export protein [Candidatus Helarchaeota archaeon]|nr:small multi-drug export protein [Candidatus Helarchaeota archaeon]